MSTSSAGNPFAQTNVPAVSQEELSVEGSFGRFTLGELVNLGRCKWGRKYDSLDLSLSRRVVVWRFETPREIKDSEQVQQAIAAQVQQLLKLRHPRLCPYLGCELLHDQLHIVTGYAPGGSVADWLADSGPISEEAARRVVQAAAEGLGHLHACGEQHGAVHCGNLLLGPGVAVRLVDFGLQQQRLSRGCSAVRRRVGNQLPWLAPEVEAEGRCTAFSDIWALGCAVVEMLAVEPTWSSDSALPAQVPCQPSKLPVEAQRFVNLCLQSNPFMRPLTAKLLADPWFAMD